MVNRVGRGRFRKGESGNPKGKPKGLADRRIRYRDLFVPHAEELVKKAIDLALSGDVQAIRLCIDRLVSAIKPTDEPLVLKHKGVTLTQKGAEVLKAVADGKISPWQGQTLMNSIQVQTRVVEAEELSRRVDALETALQLSLPLATKGAGDATQPDTVAT